MQFKHPEILYFLALLIIPIIVHLFQLQKFVKVPFTNVAFLQKLAMQTRKSSKIKKWLVLATRLLLLTFLILAFAQPYFSNRSANEQSRYHIFLDNSLSTNTQGKKGDLLQVASQEIIDNLSEKASYTLQTNAQFYRNKTASELKEILLKIENTPQQKEMKEVVLKLSSENSLYDTPNKNIVISDFQNATTSSFKNLETPTSFVQLTPQLKENLSIDSVTVDENGSANFTVNITVKNQGIAKKDIPIAIYNHQKLINKQTFSIDENVSKKVTFSIQKTPTFLGKVLLNYNDAFSFDNTFYFTLNSGEKINVLSIGKQPSFLSKVYTKDEFNFLQYSVDNINYNAIPNQQLIVLNEVESIPNTLIASLVDFTKKGGNLVIIPHQKSSINTYNNLLKQLQAGQIVKQHNDSLKVTNIQFNHPIFKHVFEKQVRNFQYPYVASYYNSSLKRASSILNFENKKPFISQVQLENAALFWVASSLNKENSNFINSPIIVPIFYNIGKQSLQLSKLYYTIGKQNTIDVHKRLGKETVLSIKNKENAFIPLQRVFQSKVSITTTEQPLKAGFHFVMQEKDTLKSLAFNYPKEESSLEYTAIQDEINNSKSNTISTSVKETLQEIRKKNEVQWLWKWFLALSIVSLLLEILILKFFKP
ncbi:N-terminal double-transmembrane domain-containing protein [Tenacibaculum sp. 190524A02b]|uniref:N-terminal double-transmembrane domain-containing protein n=1 Tax=Tenacibaculum vairaonense TaxID=3137860 RepID=A0ABM9PLG1_9FLAO